MKFYIYFDIQPWQRDGKYVYPTTNPDFPKYEGSKRYRIEVEVDDPAEPDETAKGVAVEMIDEAP